MRVIKFDVIYGVPGDISTCFRKQFTLDQLISNDHFDEIADSPLLRNYRVLHKRQFTGLTDKNGAEIYEGDVAHFPEKGSMAFIGKVVFMNCCFAVDHGEKGNESMLDDGFEVIGNIHQNPDLVEVVK